MTQDEFSVIMSLKGYTVSPLPNSTHATYSNKILRVYAIDHGDTVTLEVWHHSHFATYTSYAHLIDHLDRLIRAAQS